MNDKLADIFDDMAREYKKDRYRTRAYTNAAIAIRKHPTLITSGKQAQEEIKGIGKSIGTKIDEIIATGKLKLLEDRPEEKKLKDKVTKEFEKIYGVGIVTAEKWYDMGYHSFESLANLYPQMTEQQQLGYKYYQDLQTRIPRSEIDSYVSILNNIWPGITYEIAGSYRRGESTSGDIDILVLNQSIDTLIDILADQGLIVGTLALGPTKYMGIIKLTPNDKARRIDIRSVNEKAWPYALLYFTGPKDFNVEMRTKALAMGLSMNEYGMVNEKGENILAKSERDIFKSLGMTYLEPNERSFNKQKETGKWYRPTDSLLVYVSNDVVNTGNVAAFDLDWTLIRPYKSSFPATSDDLKILPNRLTTLQEAITKGYTLVVFTNQKSTTENKLKINFDRINNFIKMVGVPVMLFMAIKDDIYRKPNIGMWNSLKSMIDVKSAFYVGDAAGREADFSDSDKLFAQNIGIDFYTPDQIFLPIERLKPEPKVGLNELPLFGNKMMIIFVGMPGSGKSTYYETVFKPLGYAHVNQDMLGTKAKVIKAVKENINLGKNIVIDRTNPKQSDREIFYNLAKENGYNIVVLYLVRDGKGYNKLRVKPVPTIAYSTYFKYLEEPTPNNTPGSLYQIF